MFADNMVLTAAHCCKAVTDYGSIASDVKIVAGLVRLRNEFQSNRKYREETHVKEMIIHPNYTGRNDNFQNDICILRLEDQFNLGSMIAKIPLLKNDSLLEGTKCTISGWGTTRVCKSKMCRYFLFLHLLQTWKKSTYRQKCMCFFPFRNQEDHQIYCNSLKLKFWIMMRALIRTII